jgi:hypothetical protein
MNAFNYNTSSYHALFEEIVMTASERTLASRILEETGATWLLRTSDRILLLDVALSDTSLEHKTVSVVGTMGFHPARLGLLS